MAAIDLPPWGVMDASDLDEISAGLPPPDWSPDDGSPSTPAKWRAWRSQVIDELAAFLWPRYDPVGRQWLGQANSLMESLSRADLLLMHTLKDQLELPIQARSATTVAHFELFGREDDGYVGADYRWYDPSLSLDRRKRMTGLVTEGYQAKCGSYDLQLKHALMRPRPRQVAMLYGEGSFSCHLALTATTPSMVSGHCLQGVLAGCHVFDTWMTEGFGDAATMGLLSQFTVDIGDRRVFAGVHYPSDNISSWFSAFRIIPHVFLNPRPVIDFLWSAITTRSIVYKAMAMAASNVPGRAYESPLTVLGARVQSALAAVSTQSA